MQKSPASVAIVNSGRVAAFTPFRELRAQLRRLSGTLAHTNVSRAVIYEEGTRSKSSQSCIASVDAASFSASDRVAMFEAM
ncbi:MAG: hypothetical protein ACI9KE_001010 [Polyangiales bacterium]|jgi:hypothetical protein